MHELLIAGDSHIVALSVEKKHPAGDYKVEPIPEHGQGVLGLIGAWPREFDNYWDAIQEHARGRAVAVTWGGNRHLTSFLFAPTPMFDYVVACRPDLPVNTRIDLIPEAAIREFFAMNPVKERLKKLNTVAQKVLFFGTPPPKKDDKFLRSQFDKEPYFINLADKMGLRLEEVSLSPPLLRLKLWLSLQSLMQDICIETDSQFIPVPVESLTEDGYLHPSCYANDVTHANKFYGDLMVRDIKRAAK